MKLEKPELEPALCIQNMKLSFALFPILLVKPDDFLNNIIWKMVGRGKLKTSNQWNVYPEKLIHKTLNTSNRKQGSSALLKHLALKSFMLRIKLYYTTTITFKESKHRTKVVSPIMAIYLQNIQIHNILGSKKIHFTFHLHEALRLNITFAFIKILATCYFQRHLQIMVDTWDSNEYSANLLSFLYCGVFSKFYLYLRQNNAELQTNFDSYHPTEALVHFSVIVKNVLISQADTCYPFGKGYTSCLVAIQTERGTHHVHHFGIQTQKDMKIHLNMSRHQYQSIFMFDGPGTKSVRSEKDTFWSTTFQCFLVVVSKKLIFFNNRRNKFLYQSRHTQKSTQILLGVRKINIRDNIGKSVNFHLFNFTSTKKDESFNITIYNLKFSGDPSSECLVGGIAVMEVENQVMSVCDKGKGDVSTPFPQRTFTHRYSLLVIYSYMFYSSLSVQFEISTTKCKFISRNPCEQRSGKDPKLNMMTDDCLLVKITGEIYSRQMLKICKNKLQFSHVIAHPQLFCVHLRGFLQLSVVSKIIFVAVESLKVLDLMNSKMSNESKVQKEITSNRSSVSFSVETLFQVPTHRLSGIMFFMDRWKYNFAEVRIFTCGLSNRTLLLVQFNILLLQKIWFNLSENQMSNKFSLESNYTTSTILFKAFTNSEHSKPKYFADLIFKYRLSVIFRTIYFIAAGTIRHVDLKVHKESLVNQLNVTLKWLSMKSSLSNWQVVHGKKKLDAKYVIQTETEKLNMVKQILLVIKHHKTPIRRFSYGNRRCRKQFFSWKQATDLCQNEGGSLPLILHRGDQDELLRNLQVLKNIFIEAFYILHMQR